MKPHLEQFKHIIELLLDELMILTELIVFNKDYVNVINDINLNNLDSSTKFKINNIVRINLCKRRVMIVGFIATIVLPFNMLTTTIKKYKREDKIACEI